MVSTPPVLEYRLTERGSANAAEIWRHVSSQMLETWSVLDANRPLNENQENPARKEYEC